VKLARFETISVYVCAGVCALMFFAFDLSHERFAGYLNEYLYTSMF
jgi:hypothetical protein